VKVPVASEMLRSAPPYTDRAREEPCQGGAGVATGSLADLDFRPLGDSAACREQTFRKK
jgi:hypothetical protein